MYDERGIWIDDATGVPDIMMPPNMVQPNTAGYHPRPSAVPQNITPTPMAPERPVPMGSSPQMKMLMNPQDAGINPEPVSDPLTGKMITDEWNKLTPPEAQNPFLTALKAPITAPLGIMEEIMGLFGEPTIEGWAQKAEARYGNPDATESRAFGVPVAKEPAFGDRFTGLVTGKSQQRAMAGKLLRSEVGRYNKQRQAEIQTFKNVGDIYAQGQTLQSNQFKLDTQGEDFETKMAARKAATRASGLAGDRSSFLLGRDQAREARMQSLAAAIRENPALARDPKALMLAAGGDLDLANKAVQFATGQGNIPDPATGLTLGQQTQAQLGPVPAIAEAYGADAIAQAKAEADAAKLEAANARADAEKATTRQQQLADASGTLEQALAKEARGRVEDLYKPRLAGLTSDWFDKTRVQKAEEMNQEKARVIALLETGELPRNDAYAIASGDLSALATPIDQPTPAPTIAPSPTPTPSPSPTRESPAQIRERVLEEKTAEILGGGARPTPMATPTPRPTTSASPEGARQDNATRVTQFMARFDEKWKRERVPLGKPLRGADYYRDLDTNLARLGLKRETTD